MSDTKSEETPESPTLGLAFDSVYIFVPKEGEPRRYLREQVTGHLFNQIVQVVTAEGQTLTFIGFSTVFELAKDSPNRGKEFPIMDPSQLSIPFDRLKTFVPTESKPRVYAHADVRKQLLNIVTVTDSEGDELTYAGVPLLFEKDAG